MHPLRGAEAARPRDGAPVAAVSPSRQDTPFGPVIDLTVEDPPIEDVIERVFAQNVADSRKEDALPKLPGDEVPTLPTDKVPRLPTDKVPRLPTDKVPRLPTDKVPRLPTDDD